MIAAVSSAPREHLERDLSCRGTSLQDALSGAPQADSVGPAHLPGGKLISEPRLCHSVLVQSC